MERRKPDCVVVDTNLWRSQYLLNTPVGEALVYTLSRQGAYLGLPEVVERELKPHIVKTGLDAVRKLEDSARIVTFLSDRPQVVFPPTEAELEKKVEQRLAQLQPIIIRVPFTFEHANAALEMVYAKLPPNGPEDQQFKDSAIWQAVITLSKNYNVHFVTNDRAFLAKRGDDSSGLAPNLQDDCRKAGGNVTIYCSLSSCIKSITGDVPSFDQKRLASLIETFVLPRLRDRAAGHKFEIGEVLGLEIQACRTNVPNRLAVDYTITLRLTADPSEITERINCRVVANGGLYYDPNADISSGDFLASIAFMWTHPSGGECVMATGFSEGCPVPFPRPPVGSRAR